MPNRLEEVKEEFVDPLVEIVSELMHLALGSNGVEEPSLELMKIACSCLSSILNQLVTVSLNYEGLDLLNASEEYAKDPLWTPFVTYHKAKDYVKWNKPTKESFNLAKSLLQRFLVPLLNMLYAVAEELKTYLNDSSIDPGRPSGFPQIPGASGHTKLAYQKTYISCLIRGILCLTAAIGEGLQPRTIPLEDMEHIKEICSDLEFLRQEFETCPESSQEAARIRLDIPFFDLPSETDGSTLRDRIFKGGLEFLDVLAQLAEKCDFESGEISGEHYHKFT